jgi:hypothetical protein
MANRSAQEKNMRKCTRVVLLACLTLTASCASAEKQAPFTGDWSYGTDCNGGHYITIELQQSGKNVTGEWSEGSNSSGDQGFLKGEIKAGTLVAVYCSSTGVAGTQCPQYDTTIEDHFTMKGVALMRAQKIGSVYKNDVILLPAKKAKVERCTDKDE